MSPRLLITRPIEDAEPMAATLQTRGFACLLEPMLSIQPIQDQIAASQHFLTALEDVQVIMTTSYNSVRFLPEELWQKLTVPVLTIGHRTERYLHKQHTQQIKKAGADVSEYVDYIREHYAPDTGLCVYLRGVHVRRDLKTLLPEYQWQEYRVYDAKAAPFFSDKALDSIKNKMIDGIVLYSKRTASVFLKLCEQHNIIEQLSSSVFICLSDKIAAQVAQTLEGLVPTPRVVVSDAPNHESMLEFLANFQFTKA